MYLMRDPSCVCYILNATNHPVIKSLETISHLYHCFVEENFFQHSELELLCLQWLHFRVMPRDLIVTKQETCLVIQFIMISVDNDSIFFVLPGKSEHQEKLDAALKVRITLKQKKVFTSFPCCYMLGNIATGIGEIVGCNLLVCFSLLEHCLLSALAMHLADVCATTFSVACWNAHAIFLCWKPVGQSELLQHLS